MRQNATRMLIVMAHGSPKVAWRSSVEQVVQGVQSVLGQTAVRLAYMDCTPPTLMDVAGDAVTAGVGGVRVLPLFLAWEGHVDRDVRPLVDAVREVHGAELDVVLLPPVGLHPGFRDLIRQIAADGQAESW